MRKFEKLSIGVLLLLAALFFPLPVAAQEGVNRAGLIVVFDEGEVFTDCVTFVGQLTGYELLERAGLSVVVKDYGGGLGFAICKIGDVGRDYPAESCFRTTDDISWRYWYWEDGGWIYSGSGASNRTIGDGDLDAWVWGAGETEPPSLDFAALCAPPTEIPTETSIETHTPTPTLDRVAIRIATSVAQSRPTPVPASEKEGPRRDYGAFALLVAVLVVLIGYATLLRRQGG